MKKHYYGCLHLDSHIVKNYINNETGLPLFDSYASMKLMNEFLVNLNTKIVLKIHHLQKGLEIFKKDFSNIQFITDEDISNKGLQLYQFIPVFDALITDYSSISQNATDFMPGDHVMNISQLENAIERVVEGIDFYRKERNILLPKFHTYRDGNASKRILNHLEIVKGECE